MVRCRKLGLDIPCIYFINIETKRIYMEYIHGSLMKEILQSPSISDEYIKNLFEKMGIYLATLHNGDIIHGDLTTSNMIIREESNELVSLTSKSHSTVYYMM
jgi:TP53 regulating kinase-like protein